MKQLCLAGFLLAGLFLSGCHGSGEIIKLRIQHVESAVDSKGASLTVAVSPFDDQREVSEHLGLRIHQGGDKTYFDVMDGTLGQSVTSSFVQFLNQSGFSASPAESIESADIRIEPAIKKFRVQATDKLLSSFLEVDAIMAFTIHNSADESTVRIAIGVGATDHNVFFTKNDLEKLINEVLAEGFEELMEKTEIREQGLKFHLLEKSS